MTTVSTHCDQPTFSMRGAVLVVSTIAIIILTSIFLFLHLEDGISRPVQFSLVNQHKESVTQEDIKGSWSIVSFGFTKCVDVCPAQLANMTGVIRKLRERDVIVNSIFVTVDPKNDTTESLKGYLSHFDNSIQGLTGTVGDIKEAIDSFNVFSSNFDGNQTKQPEQKQMIDHSGEHDPTAGSAHMMPESEIVHSASIYLVNQSLKITTYFNPSFSVDEVTEAIVGAINQEDV